MNETTETGRRGPAAVPGPTDTAVVAPVAPRGFPDAVTPADHAPAAPVPGLDEPPPYQHHRLRSLAMFVAPAVGLVLLFGVWEAYVRIAEVRRITLPTPSSIVVHIFEEPGFYWRNAKVTMVEAGWGFLLAFVVACLLAVAMAHSRFVERAAFPVIIMIQSTPIVVLAPVFLIWFGFGIMPKVLIAALLAWIPFVTNAYTGFRSIDANTYEVTQSVNASRWEVFWRLRVPHSLPYLFSAGRICLGLSLIGAVVGEFFAGSTAGLGNAARVAQSRQLVDQLWGSIFVLAFIGIAATLLLMAVERRVLRWHSSQHHG